MLLPSTPSANGIRSSLLGTFRSQRTAPKAISARLTTTWPASRSMKSQIRMLLRLGGQSGGNRNDRTFGGGLKVRGDVFQIRDLLRIELHVDPVGGDRVAGIGDRHADLAEHGERRALDVHGVGVDQGSQRFH